MILVTGETGGIRIRAMLHGDADAGRGAVVDEIDFPYRAFSAVRRDEDGAVNAIQRGR